MSLPHITKRNQTPNVISAGVYSTGDSKEKKLCQPCYRITLKLKLKSLSNS